MTQAYQAQDTRYEEDSGPKTYRKEVRAVLTKPLAAGPVARTSRPVGYVLLPVMWTHLLRLSLNQKLARVQHALGILHMW